MPCKFLITGGNGQLAVSFKKMLTSKNIPCTVLTHKDLDITNAKNMESLILKFQPDVVLNCAAYNHVDLAEQKERDKAFSVNATAVKNLTQLCLKKNIVLVHYSSDAVFDGKKTGLYTEDDPTHPISEYGKSKLAGEQYLTSSKAKFLLFRVSWVYGEGERNFLTKLQTLIDQKKPLRMTCDRFSVPTYADDIARVTLKALDAGLTGLYHCVNSGYASRYEFARTFIEAKGINKDVFPALASDFVEAAKRPFFGAMSNQKISKALRISIPSWQDSLQEYVKSLGE